MKLLKFRLENFCGIENEVINFSSYTSLIGPNNAGKSTFLRAINLFLNQVHPDPSDWNKHNSDGNIVFEGTFGDLQEWEIKKPGISPHVVDGEIKIRVEYSSPGARFCLTAVPAV